MLLAEVASDLKFAAEDLVASGDKEQVVVFACELAADDFAHGVGFGDDPG